MDETLFYQIKERIGYIYRYTQYFQHDEVSGVYEIDEIDDDDVNDIHIKLESLVLLIFRQPTYSVILNEVINDHIGIIEAFAERNLERKDDIGKVARKLFDWIECLKTIDEALSM